MKKTDWLLSSAVIIFFLTGFIFYPYLPAQVASHWNTAGVVDGYMSRMWGTFLTPIIFLCIAILFFLIPRMDPKRSNIEKFGKYFNLFITFFSIVFYYIYVLTLLWNLGYQFNFTTYLTPAIAAIFYIIGVVLPHTKPNWSIGIRTPWTISNEVVWRKTHQAGGIAFKICALIILFGVAVPSLIIWFILTPIVLTVLGLTLYSYLLYEREEKARG